MRRQLILATIRSRFRRYTTGMLALAGGAICGILIVTAPFKPSHASLAAFFLSPFALVALAPIPWQWTGDDRPLAGQPRGLLQALLFNWIWTLPFMALPAPPGPPGAVFPPATGPATFVWAAVTGFGWLWSEKEAVEARERAAEINLRERLEVLVAERTKELSLKTHQVEEAMDSLKNQSLTDPLTGIKNRRYLSLTLPEDVAQVFRAQRTAARSSSQRLTLNIDLVFLMVDVDNFKEVNDNYGHGAGDLVLCRLAELLGRAVRDSDKVIRWGGEEFLVVARDACRADGHTLAERIRKEVAEMEFHIGQDQFIHCSCSVGFVVYPLIPGPEDSLSWQGAVDLADQCLYAAKRAGRNAWVGLTPNENVDPDLVPKASPLDIEQGLTQGLFRVHSSLAPGRELTW